MSFILTIKEFFLQFKRYPFKPTKFSEKFVAANEALARGDSDGLKAGIKLLIEGLSVAGPHSLPLRKAIRHLYSALSFHDRADSRGPWNWDLSGYGILSWKADLCDRNEALRQAWPYIEAINKHLQSTGLGWSKK
jgi:hypothetical protein